MRYLALSAVLLTLLVCYGYIKICNGVGKIPSGHKYGITIVQIEGFKPPRFCVVSDHGGIEQ